MKVKVKAIICKVADQGFSVNIPAITPVCFVFGETLKDSLENLYERLAKTDFTVQLVDDTPRLVTKQERVLELYVEPGNRYPITKLRQFEMYALKIVEQLPGARAERAPDVIQISLGDFSDEKGLVLILTPEAIELRLPTIKWLGPHTPVSSSQLWKRVEWDWSKEVDLAELVASAQNAQQQSFRVCKYCGKRKPPGWMFKKEICDSCAERHLGVIH